MPRIQLNASLKKVYVGTEKVCEPSLNSRYFLLGLRTEKLFKFYPPPDV